MPLWVPRRHKNNRRRNTRQPLLAPPYSSSSKFSYATPAIHSLHPLCTLPVALAWITYVHADGYVWAGYLPANVSKYSVESVHTTYMQTHTYTNSRQGRQAGKRASVRAAQCMHACHICASMGVYAHICAHGRSYLLSSPLHPRRPFPVHTYIIYVCMWAYLHLGRYMRWIGMGRYYYRPSPYPLLHYNMFIYLLDYLHCMQLRTHRRFT